MYEWYWGHTAAQIELLDIDQPITVYRRHDADLKPGDKGYKPNAKKLDEAVEKWKKRKAEREKRGFRLDKFLQSGVKEPIDNTNT